MMKMSSGTLVGSGKTGKDSTQKIKKKTSPLAENFVGRGSDIGFGLPTILEYKSKGHGKNDGSKDA